MMLADVGYIESLSEKLRSQRLDDGIYKDECFVRHHSAYKSISRLPPCMKTVVYCDGSAEINDCEKTESVLRTRAGLTTEFRALKPRISELAAASSSFNQPRQKDDPVTKILPIKEPRSAPNPLPEIRFLRKRNDEGIEFSSSSEEELRELFLRASSMKRTAVGKIHRPIAPLELCQRKTQLGFNECETESVRKRCKSTRGNLKKKLRISRPSLNMDKMMATKLYKGKKEKKDFLPIRET
ncbi:uncharacterized protein LOC116617066 [Nematostella vectensis]|uniref:uncharacterized protein LOC116617066 n=1 Tax=Nematostella vectensis TaxID=45351 RepID=UPI001390269E|nr:uncharacterized protein LOC116617066 [Nematostella vectensis]